MDRDFPCLEPKECVAKFGFTCLGLVEHKNGKTVTFETTEVLLRKENREEELKKGEKPKNTSKLKTIFDYETVFSNFLIIHL